MPDIRMIWFDIGRVLCDHHTDAIMIGLSAIANPKQKPHEVFSKIEENGLIKRYDLGVITTEQFVEEMQKLVSFSDREAFLSLWKSALTPNRLVCELATALRKNFYLLGIISNTNELQATNFERTLYAESATQFQPRIYSYKERIAKPDPAIFQLAIDRANRELPWQDELLPSECVFIDDHIENAEAVRRMGWHAVHHIPVFVTKTYAELAKLGVRI